MILSMSNGNDGWTPYTMGPDGNRLGSVLITGDPSIGDKICKSTSYNTGQYDRYVLSFYDDLSVEKAKEVYDNYIELLMIGYRRDEYHNDGVAHFDTKYIHIHGRTPKLNLLTGNQLKLYNHRTDLKRIEAIKAYLVVKYNLTPTINNLRRDPHRKKRVIKELRAMAGQEPFKFSTKGSKEDQRMRLEDIALGLITSGTATCLNDIKKAFIELDLGVVKQDYDRSLAKHYLTLKNMKEKDGETLRVFGQYFSEKFYSYSPDQQKKAIQNNKEIVDTKTLEKLVEELQVLQDKRVKFIIKTYSKSRARAEKNKKKVLVAAKREAIESSIKRPVNEEETPVPRESKISTENRSRVTRAEAINARTEQRRRSVNELVERTKQAIISTEHKDRQVDRVSIEKRQRNEHIRRDKKSFRRYIADFTNGIGNLIQKAAEEAISEVIADMSVIEKVAKEKEIQPPLEIRSILQEEEEVTDEYAIGTINQSR